MSLNGRYLKSRVHTLWGIDNIKPGDLIHIKNNRCYILTGTYAGTDGWGFYEDNSRYELLPEGFNPNNTDINNYEIY